MAADWRRTGELLGQNPAELIAQRRRVFTVSNFVTLVRVIVLPFLLWSISLPIEQGLRHVIVFSAIVSLSDLLDGFVARRLHQVSDTGRVIDPIADKLCIGGAAITLTIYRGLPLWIPAIIVGRDALIVLGSVVLAKRANIVLPSNQLGRLTTVVLTITLFIYAIDWHWPERVLVWTSAALVAASLAVYLRIGWHMLGRLRRA